MKKLTTLLFALLTMQFVFADSTYNEYPRYGFWSNWSVGVTADFSKQGNGHGMVIREGASFGGDITLQKQLDEFFDLRIKCGVVGLLTDFDLPAQSRYARYGTVAAGFTLDVLTGIVGYNPERRSHLYLFADGGVAIYNNYLTRTNDDIHKMNLVIDGGVGYRYDICRHSSVLAEVQMNDVSHLPNIFKANHLGLDALVRIGYLYRFGATAADEELIAQRALLTEENMERLSDSLRLCEQECDIKDEQIRRLWDRIFDIEQDTMLTSLQNMRIESLQKNNHRLDSVICSIREHQLEEYALPFSILFDIDSYVIRDDQRGKLRAIADLMKNTGETYRVCGFADYSGSDEYNVRLSERRANAVKRALVRLGVDGDKLSVERYGKGRPFADAKHAVNRKVSFYRNIEE